MAAANLRSVLTGLAVFALLAMGQATQTANAQAPIRVMLAGRLEGPVAPFFVAADRGHYRAEGLDVTLETGVASSETIARIATGTSEIGFADINELIRLHDRNPSLPVKAVFVVYNSAPYAIVGRRSRGIATPKDLEGKKLGAPATDPSFAAWPLFARLNGVDAAKIDVENVGVPVREPMLAAGQLDAVIGFSFASEVDLKERGVPPDDIVALRMSDYGLALYGSAIMVNSKFAAENPERVSAFLRAYTRGLRETIASPAQAIEAVLTRADGANRGAELERLRMALRENILTPEVKADGFGGIEPDRFRHALDQMELQHKFKARPALADVFDASFLPEPVGRQAH